MQHLPTHNWLGWGGGGGCSYEGRQIMKTGEECLSCRENASAMPMANMESMHNLSCITLIGTLLNVGFAPIHLRSSAASF